MPIQQLWLDQYQEEPLEPELPICDPHHHFWDRPDGRYLLNELLTDTSSGHNIQSTVFVECLSNYRQDLGEALAPVGETVFVDELAEQSASGEFGKTQAGAGIISFADLLLGTDVQAVLESHSEASTRFRGIRHACSWDSSTAIRRSHTNPPPQLYLNSKFREGFACLSQFNWVFDAWLYHSQLPELISLAEAFPHQTIVLDHVGGPLGIGPYQGKREEVFQSWKKHIVKLAHCKNVSVKLGGLGMAINGFGWHKLPAPPSSKQLAQANAPYIETCIEAFGIERCMFESNFPVDKVSSSYGVLWNSFKRITEHYSEHEKAKLFHDNAVTIYSLEPAVSS
ncbi:MAG: amidohydrolase [Pseudohongiellaceae bacterium]